MESGEILAPRITLTLHPGYTNHLTMKNSFFRLNAGKRIMYNAPLGPIAQLVRAGDSSIMVRPYRKVWNERDEFRETLTARLMATLSQASGAPLEGAETT